MSSVESINTSTYLKESHPMNTFLLHQSVVERKTWGERARAGRIYACNKLTLWMASPIL